MLASIMSWSFFAYALQEDHQDLKGPAFSNPDEIMEMPESWIKQTIKHDPSSGKADIVITVNQNYFEIVEPIIGTYEKKHGLHIVLHKGTCGISAGMLSNKTADIGGFCCPPGRTDRLPGLKFHTLGIVALAIIVHPDNPVEDITLKQARQIFMGEIYRWSELGRSQGRELPNLPIQPVGRLHCKLRSGHWRGLLDNEDLFSPGIVEVGAIPDMISQVAENENAIGFETISMIRHLRDKGRVKILKISGNDPANESDLISGKYPLYRVYNITTWEGGGVENPYAANLVKHLLNEMKTVDSEFGMVPAFRLRKSGWLFKKGTGWKFRDNELIGEPH